MASTVGLLHPGEMGASVGAAARAAGARVVFCSKDRSPATLARAGDAGLEDVGSLEALLAESELVLSVCPPLAALEQARRVGDVGFDGVYVDANAVAPGTAREVAATVELAGARFVDGGIVGPPARERSRTRVYLAGSEAPRVAALLDGEAIEAIVLGGPPGVASALKVCFAAYTKGTAALLTAIRCLAGAEGVEADLLAEWSRSLPELPARSEGAPRATARKAWRFVGEMDEIAAAFAAAGLPDGFHRAASELYRRLERFKHADELPPLDEILASLLRR